jgi:hypothetical protein
MSMKQIVSTNLAPVDPGMLRGMVQLRLLPSLTDVVRQSDSLLVAPAPKLSARVLRTV